MSIAATAGAGLMAAAVLFSPAKAGDARDQFFTSLKDLCGARFEGAKTFPADGQDDFAGKLLVASVASCSDAEVRVPFLVGEDRSRTWIFSRTANGLQLKHDHRHADGTPDAVTMYGGMASATGTPFVQSFKADSHTARLIPAAVTNVWTVSLSADGTMLTYHLERDAKPRFTAVLKREPAVAQQTLHITESGMGPIELGMTLGEARRAFPSARFERGSDGEGAALVNVSFDSVRSMSLFADEDDAGAPIDWSKPIKSIECFSPLCRTPSGAHPGSLVVDVEKLYGKARKTIKSEIESREYIEFQRQPAWLAFRLDYSGIFAAGSRETRQFDRNGEIHSVVVSSF